MAERQDKEIQFIPKQNIYWEDWGRMQLVFKKDEVYTGTLHEDGAVTAKTPYFHGISDYVNTELIEIFVSGVNGMKASMKEKRKEILSRIDKLQGKCTCQSHEERDKCDNCAKIAQLGEKRSKLVSKRKTVVTGVVKE